MTDRPILKANEWPKSKVSYVYDGFLPRKLVSMVAGKRAEGKSLFAAWLAAQITMGQAIQPDGSLIGNRPAGKVWVNSMEDAPDSVARWRLQAAGADLDRVFLTEGNRVRTTWESSEPGLTLDSLIPIRAWEQKRNRSGRLRPDYRHQSPAVGQWT